MGRAALLAVLASFACWASVARGQITGQVLAHDPSTVLYEDGRYYYFNTGDLLDARSSANLANWSTEPSPFGAIPSWIPSVVTDGNLTYSGESLWAPDVIKLGDLYYLYYSASIWGTKLSAIGYATSPTLDPGAANYGWTDQGMIISSNHGSNYNAIDPAMMLDQDTGRAWMTWGSFNAGIFVMEIDPATGQQIGSGTGVNVAAPGETHEIEGASMMQRDGYYYLFTNWGGCCSGVDSTYNIRVGRSTSPTGPFLDRDGVDMTQGGGTLFIDDDGRKIGPGHFSYLEVDGQDKFSFHYYDGARDGFPTFDIQNFYWTADGWPMMAEVDSAYTGGGGAWSEASAWRDGLPNGVGQIASFAASSGAGRTVTIGRGGATVGTINFRGSVPFEIGAASGRPAIDLDDLTGEEATINLAAGAHTIHAAIHAADDLGVNVTPSAGLLTVGAVNAPVLNKYGAGTLRVNGLAATSGGVFVRNGVVDVAGTFTTNSFSSVGQIVGEEGRLRVSGAGQFHSQGDLNIGDSGDAQTPAAGVLEVRDDALVRVTSGGLYVGSGFFANSRADGAVEQTGGTVEIVTPSAGSLTIAGRNSSATTGQYNLSGGAVDAQGLVYVGRQGEGELNVSGDGVFTAHRGVRIGNGGAASGVVNLSGGTLATTFIDRGVGLASLYLDGGELRALGDSTDFVDSGIAVELGAGGVTINTDSHDVTILRAFDRDLDLGRVVDGGLTKTGVGALTLTADSDYRGPTVVAEGELILANTAGQATGFGEVSVLANGLLGGDGSYHGALSVEAGGVVAPDGRLSGAVGAATFRDGATLELDIAGPVPGTQHDQLAAGASGDMILEVGALLHVAIADGYSPGLGDAFEIATARSILGEFTGVTVEGLDSSLGLGVLYQTSSIVLEVVAAGLPGDFNADGRVDAADYTVWRDGLGSVYSQDDYGVWVANYGAPSAGVAGAVVEVVPEPSVLAVVVCGAAFGVRRRL